LAADGPPPLPAHRCPCFYSASGDRLLWAVQDFLHESLRVIKAATDLNGDLGRALFWFRNEPLAVFGYRTPERLVSEGRTDDLLRYVMSLEAGASG